MEVANRFKGLDLIKRLLEQIWMEVHDIVQETRIKTIPKKKKGIQAKWLSEEALEIAEEDFIFSPCYSLELCILMGVSFIFSFACHFSFHSYL